MEGQEFISLIINYIFCFPSIGTRFSGVFGETDETQTSASALKSNHQNIVSTKTSLIDFRLPGNDAKTSMEEGIMNHRKNLSEQPSEPSDSDEDHVIRLHMNSTSSGSSQYYSTSEYAVSSSPASVSTVRSYVQVIK